MVVVGWPFSPPITVTLARTPPAGFSLLLLPPEAESPLTWQQVPRPSLTLTPVLVGGSLAPMLGGQGSMALSPSPPCGAPLK